MEVTDGIVIHSPPGRWVNVVDGVCLDKLARPGDVRSPRVIPADSWLPGAVKAVVAAENPPHTAQRHHDPEHCRQMVPDDFGTALKLCANRKDLSYDFIWYGCRAGVGLRRLRWDAPGAK